MRLLAHEKAQRWNQHPSDRHREEKGDDVGSEVRVKMLEKQVKAMAAPSLSEYLRQRALGYEPGGHPPTEVFDVLDKIDEMAESCQPSAGTKIAACADEIRDLLIGGN